MGALTPRVAIVGALAIAFVLVAISALSAESKSVNEENLPAILSYPGGERARYLAKRQAPTTTTNKPKSTTKRHHKSSTTKKHKGHTSTSSHQPHHSTSTTTTHAPLHSSSTHASTATSTSTSTTIAPPTGSGSTTTSKPLDGHHKKWLLHEERVAIEHMVAGVYDWIKVLKQTKGTVLNDKLAGELFYVFEDKLKPLLEGDSKHDKLKEKWTKENNMGDEKKEGKKEEKKEEKKDIKEEEKKEEKKGENKSNERKHDKKEKRRRKKKGESSDD